MFDSWHLFWLIMASIATMLHLSNIEQNFLLIAISTYLTGIISMFFYLDLCTSAIDAFLLYVGQVALILLNKRYRFTELLDKIELSDCPIFHFFNSAAQFLGSCGRPR
jgi:hypothetical protein